MLARAANALTRRGVRVAMLAGEAPSASFPVPVSVVPELGYDAGEDGRRLTDALQAAARAALGGAPDIWHIHNHSLGKNTALPEAVSQLAERGDRLLLQLHDFAEDGRPENYKHLLAADAVSRLYPVAHHVHYALLNRRDVKRMSKSGCPPACLHLLPNPIEMSVLAAPPVRGVVLYPTRAIRRKNLGEFLFAASFDREGRRFQTTLEPSSAADRPTYERWRLVARELGLPVDFAVGVSHPRGMAELLAGAEAVFTSSVAEGFGLAFLEPWLAGRPVYGRDLPEITSDFKEEGLDLSMLYQGLPVPADWIAREELCGVLESSLRKARAVYGRSTGPGEVAVALDAASAEESIDFGHLSEALQERVLRRSVGEKIPLARKEFLAPLPPDTLARNARVVADRFSSEQYAARLEFLYAALAGSPVGVVEFLDHVRMLDQFLDPADFNLLRT